MPHVQCIPVVPLLSRGLRERSTGKEGLWMENGKIGLSPDVASNIQQGLENIVHKVVESESLNLSIKTKNFAIEVIIYRVNVTLRFWGTHYTKI